jgi:molybdenum cofactor biosynthesis enzyme MoaA
MDSLIFPNITEIAISVDAGCEETYKTVRLGGSWKVLIENFEFLKTLGKNKITTLNFAIQNKNFRDLPKFIELCQHYQFGTNVHQLDDWGTWNSDVANNPDPWTLKNGTFMDHDVLNHEHINFTECKSIIQDIISTKKLSINITPRVNQLLKLDPARKIDVMRSQES